MSFTIKYGAKVKGEFYSEGALGMVPVEGAFLERVDGSVLLLTEDGTIRRSDTNGLQILDKIDTVTNAGDSATNAIEYWSEVLLNGGPNQAVEASRELRYWVALRAGQSA